MFMESIIMCKILKLLALWSTGAFAYGLIEILFRGYTHISMGILGGICFLFIGHINKRLADRLSIFYQLFICTVIITTLEYITGIIVNIIMRLNVWDYSELPLNLSGQICLIFSIAWYFLSFVAIILYNILKQNLFNEPTNLSIIFTKKLKKV